MWWDRSKTFVVFFLFILYFVSFFGWLVCTFGLLLLLLCAWEFVLLFFYTSEHRLLIDDAEIKMKGLKWVKTNWLNQITDTQFWIYFIEHLFDSFFFVVSFSSHALSSVGHYRNFCILESDTFAIIFRTILLIVFNECHCWLLRFNCVNDLIFIKSIGSA